MDVGANVVQLLLGADDAIVIIALPDRGTRGTPQAVDLPGGNGFVIADNCADGSGWGAVGAIGVGFHRSQGRGIVGEILWPKPSEESKFFLSGELLSGDQFVYFVEENKI